MKKIFAIALTVIILFSFSACSQEKALAEVSNAPAAAPTAKPTAAPKSEPLSAQYAQMLKNGTYFYSLTADTGKYSIDITAAGKDGRYYARMGSQDQYIRQMVIDGAGYVVSEWTGEQGTFDPISKADLLPDFATLEFQSTKENAGKITDVYTFKMKDGTKREHLFVFEKGKLVEMTTPEILIDGTWTVTDFNAEPSETLFEIPAAVDGSATPYAWLGYAELPQCNYFDIVATDHFYREYDFYALGHVVHKVQASDITNRYDYDGGNNIILILNGMSYVLNTKNKTFAQHDSTSIWPRTLETQAAYREQGINATGKKFVTSGSGPVPLLSESGDAASYEYYEFFADFSTDGSVFTQRDRIFFKDGDVYAIHTLITNGDHETESTEVITLVNGSPDPALFALPADFDQYKPIS